MKKILMFVFFLGLFGFNFALISNNANAGGSSTEDVSGDSLSSLTETLCNVLGFVTGSVGKTLAAFAVIFIGVTFLSGKCAWTVLVTFALGIAAIFGAPSVIKMMTGGTEGMCGKSGS